MNTVLVVAGVALAASPLIAIAVFMIRDIGWKAAVTVWGLVFAAVSVIMAGSWLIAVGAAQ